MYCCTSCQVCKNTTDIYYMYVTGGQIFKGQIDRNQQEPCIVKLNLHVLTSNLNVKQVSCGFEHTLVLTGDGTVFSFGSGR